jgi:hypothetical protein
MVAVSAARLPDVPLMVTVAGPAVAVALAVSVTTLVVVAGLVANVAVTPVGNPEAVKVTLPVNPLLGTTAIVLVALLLPPVPPGVIVTVVGLAVIVKFGGGVTVRLIVVVWVRLPDVPVTVIG